MDGFLNLIWCGSLEKIIKALVKQQLQSREVLLQYPTSNK
jgi:hypothetical protein